MMRALLPLALLGAAPATDITAAATCTLPRAETEAAFRALPVLATEDDTEADERGTIYTFKDAGFWGAPADRIKLSDYADPKAGTATQSYETLTRGEYAPARDRLLAVMGKAKCDKEISVTDLQSCDISLPPEDGWTKWVSLTQTSGVVAVTCTFRKG